MWAAFRLAWAGRELVRGYFVRAASFVRYDTAADAMCAIWGLVVGCGPTGGCADVRVRDRVRDTRYGTLGRACDEQPARDPERLSAEASGLAAEPDGRIVAAGGNQDAGTSLVVLARFKRVYRAPLSCISVSPYVLPENVKHISGVIAHRSHIKIRVSRDSADGKHPPTTIGFVDFGWHAAGGFSIRWHLRVHGQTLGAARYTTSVSTPPIDTAARCNARPPAPS